MPDSTLDFSGPPTDAQSDFADQLIARLKRLAINNRELLPHIRRCEDEVADCVSKKEMTKLIARMIDLRDEALGR